MSKRARAGADSLAPSSQGFQLGIGGKSLLKLGCLVDYVGGWLAQGSGSGTYHGVHLSLIIALLGFRSTKKCIRL